MKKKDLDYFKKKLLLMKEQILNSGRLSSSEEFVVASEDLSDEADLASNLINHQISFSIREKEMRKLKMIDHALSKLENGTFGLCEECDEEIGFNRLDKQPWAELCIVHAEEQERSQVARKRA